MRGALLNLWILFCCTGEARLEPGGERMTAPEFRLFDEAGARRSLKEFHGKVVVLGVAMDERGWPVVSRFLAQKLVRYPILMGTPEIARKYGGLKTLPHTVFIDRKGRIAATHSAALELKQLCKLIEAMLAEEP